MIPTRIIKPPHTIPCSDPRSGGTNNKLVYTCDNGREYTTEELAKLVGFTHPHGLGQRVRKHGWYHPLILKAPGGAGKRLDGGTTSSSEFQTAEWQGLSSKPRNRNLERIKPLGSWERSG